MANTTGALDLKNKTALDGTDVIQMQLSNVKVYRGAALTFQRATGYAKTLSTALLALAGGVNYGVERFLGVCMATVDNSAGAAGAVNVLISRKGLFVFANAGITIADVGAKVFFSDDQTVTKTVPAAGTGGIYAGRVEAVDAEGVWVRIDDATIPARKRTVAIQIPNPVAAAGTVRAKGYRCPAGAKAYVLALNQGYSTKPNFATSATIDANKVTAAGVRTSLSTGPVNVNNQAQAVDVDTPMALNATPANLELNPGDALEAAFVTVGALTASGDPYIMADIFEVGGSND